MEMEMKMEMAKQRKPGEMEMSVQGNTNNNNSRRNVKLVDEICFYGGEEEELPRPQLYPLLSLSFSLFFLNVRSLI